MHDRATRPLLILLLGICTAGTVRSATPSGEVDWLHYRHSPAANRFFGESSSARATVSTNAPDGVKLPAFKDSEPLFARWETPMAVAGHVWLAADRSQPDGPYDRLFVDSDVDGDLSDEEPVSAHTSSSYGMSEFGPLPVVFPGEDGPVAYHLAPYAYSSGTARLYIRGACWYEGEVRVGGEMRRCRLVDYNVNGTFNDTSVNFGQIDRIRLAEDGKWTTHYLGEYLILDGVYYQPQPARDGAFVSIAAAGPVPSGTVRFSSDLTRVSAGGENGMFDLAVSNRTARLPAGRYRLRLWTIETADEKGVPWAVTGSNFPETFEVAEGRTSMIEVGTPLEGHVTVERRGDQFYFDQDIVGRGRESVRFTRAGKRPEAPKLLVQNAAGTFKETYQFEYG